MRVLAHDTGLYLVKEQPGIEKNNVHEGRISGCQRGEIHILNILADEDQKAIRADILWGRFNGVDAGGVLKDDRAGLVFQFDDPFGPQQGGLNAFECLQQGLSGKRSGTGQQASSNMV
jgi:hypothetical protein